MILTVVGCYLAAGLVVLGGAFALGDESIRRPSPIWLLWLMVWPILVLAVLSDMANLFHR